MDLIMKISEKAHTAGAIIVGLMFISITCQVFGRMCGFPFTWVEELSGYAAIWSTFLGIGYALRQGRHVRVDLVTRTASPRTQAVMTIIGDIACVLFSIIIVWKGSYLVSVSYHVQRTTSLLGLPVYLMQIVLPIGFVIFGLEAISNAVKTWKTISYQNYSNEKSQR
jgi:TRAP-type C4-dicarboxylate transport system permease small subunit